MRGGNNERGNLSTARSWPLDKSTHGELIGGMVRTVEELVDALGGTVATATLAGVGKTAVSNWKARGSIPAENFLRLSRALSLLEKEPDPALFGLKSAEADA